MIDIVKDYLAPKRFGIVGYVCVIFHFLCGLVFTAVTAALRLSENGKFFCPVDVKSSATYKKQADQVCFARYDQAYNSPIPLYGFVLLSIDFTVLVSVIYSLLVWKRVDEIESSHERQTTQTNGKTVNCGQSNRKTVYVLNLYFVHLVLRGLFVIILTVLQHTYFYPNGFDFKFDCHVSPTDQVISNINTPTNSNASRNLNGTIVTCKNATASEKWVSGIFVSVINSIVAAVILVEVIYLLPRLPILNHHSGVGWSCDSKFVIEYLLGKQYNVPVQSQSLPDIESNPPHCSTQHYSIPDSVAQACSYSTMNDSIQDPRNQGIPDSIAQECTTMDCIDVHKKYVLKHSHPRIECLLDKQYNVPGESEPLLTSIENNPPHCSIQDYSTLDSVAQACSTLSDSIQDTRSQDTPDSIAQECTIIDNDIQDPGTEDCINFYKEQVLNRSRDPGIIYGPNVNIDDLYIDVAIHTGRALHNFPEEMKRHEIYDVYMKVPPYSVSLERIENLFYPNRDTKGKFPRSILVIGRPGIGKTVLTEKNSAWFNEDINKLINISLKTFLRFGTGLNEKNFESIYEEIAKEPQKAILIFDGLDEYHGDPISCLDQPRIIPNDPDAGMSAMNLFIKLALGDLLKEATVVVTSRPTADDFYSRLDFDRNVEIIGFTSDKIEEYVSRFCDNNNTSDLKAKTWNHIKSSSELLNLCYIPVNCFIVCVTFSGCLSDPRNKTGALPTTLTELYQTAIDHFEKHHHRNADRNSMAHEALKQLQRLAFLGMESGQLIFDQVLFDEQMKKSGLLNSLSNPIFPLQTQFCFIHLTIQEFLAARHVTETFAPPEIEQFILDYIAESGKWHLVLQFIAGLLGKKIKNFDREYKDCVFAFAESFEVDGGEIEVEYREVFIMKCLREADNEEITKEVCETTAINDLVELSNDPDVYDLSPSDWAAVTFVCKHMKRLAQLKLSGFAANCLPQVLGLLRERYLNKLELFSPVDCLVPDELVDQIFSALMELNCTFDHEHTKLTTLTLKDMSMTEAGLPIMCKFFENGHASQLKQLNLLHINGILSHEISKLCEVLNNGHCPNLTDLDL
ncbi:Hypothetical predicted protein [Paramuricea clavata]|nr:Hypothetical predicted protein [Paramuricea clavata]